MRQATVDKHSDFVKQFWFYHAENKGWAGVINCLCIAVYFLSCEAMEDKITKQLLVEHINSFS